MTVSQVARDGGTIAYEVHGSGPLVVLAHGMGENRAAFRHLTPRLVAAGYRVASVDVRVHGDTVVLGGQVHSPGERAEIERVVWNAPGIREVHNHLVVR